MSRFDAYHNTMEHTLYNLKELALDNPNAATVLERFPQIVSETQEMPKGLPADMLLELFAMFDNAEYRPLEEMKQFALADVLCYLKHTHSYYISKRLQEMELAAMQLAAGCRETMPGFAVLSSFLSNYKKNLTSHIELEEQHLFPYIDALLAADAHNSAIVAHRGSAYSIKQFIDDHDDTVSFDLSQLIVSLKEDLTALSDNIAYRVLLRKLESFKTDLAVHEWLEDEVLVPQVLAVEEKIALRLKLAKRIFKGR